MANGTGGPRKAPPGHRAKAPRALRPQRFLQKHGFRGEILPVNPGRAEIFGVKAWKTIDEVPGEIDHAYILLNGKDAVAALDACGRRGVKVASILAGGFADAGAAGASLQDELTRIVLETGIRLVGPNSIGTAPPPADLVRRCRADLDAESDCGVVLAVVDGALAPGQYSNEELRAAVAAAGYRWTPDR